MSTITTGAITGDTPASVSLISLLRTDTNQTPAGVSLPAAMTQVGSAWNYTFTDPASGLLYTGVYQINWPDGSFNQVPFGISAGSISTLSITGYYGKSSDMENQFGTTNISTYSDLENNSPAIADPVRVQAASDYADAEINEFFLDGPFSIPLSFTAPYATRVVTNWYAIIAGVWLYQSRGARDVDMPGQTNPLGGKYGAWLKAVYADMAMYKTGVKRLAAQRRWPTPTAPVGGTWMGN